MSPPPDPPDADARYDAFAKRKHFASLDGLRGLSILAVLWHHARFDAWHEAGLLAHGSMGVDLFFVISGFLITTLLLRERDRTGTIDMRAFTMRRVLRIFPLYYITLALYCMLVWVARSDTPEAALFWHNLPWFATYTSNWWMVKEHGHAIFQFSWSLAAEEQFYLLWPWIQRWCTPAVACLLAVGLAVANQLYRFAEAVPGNAHFGWLALWHLQLPILLGVVGAHLLHHRRGFTACYRICGHRWAPALAAALFSSTLTVHGLDGLAPLDDRRWDQAIITVGQLWLFVLVIACVVRPDHGFARLLDHPALVKVGQLSYGVYLLHMLPLNVWRSLFPPESELLLFMLTAGSSVVLAALAYRFVETPFLVMKRRFAR